MLKRSIVTEEGPGCCTALEESLSVAKLAVEASEAMRDLIAFELSTCETFRSKDGSSLFETSHADCLMGASECVAHFCVIENASRATNTPSSDSISVLMEAQLGDAPAIAVRPPENLCCWSEFAIATCRKMTSWILSAIRDELSNDDAHLGIEDLLRFNRIPPLQLVEIIQHPLSLHGVSAELARLMVRNCQIEFCTARAKKSEPASLVAWGSIKSDDLPSEIEEILSWRKHAYGSMGNGPPPETGEVTGPTGTPKPHNEPPDEDGQESLSLPWSEIESKPNDRALIEYMVEKRIVKNRLQKKDSIVKGAGFDPTENPDQSWRRLRKLGFTDSERAKGGGTFLTEKAYAEGKARFKS